MNHEKRKELFGVLSSLGLAGDEERRELISQFTDGRTNSVKDLSDYDADELIAKLESPEYQSADKMRKKIISMAYDMGWGNSFSFSGKVETLRRVNEWCEFYGRYNKPLNDHTPLELPHLVTQFGEMHKKHMDSI
ncbi:MAG: hypothetical protein R2800_09940 [Flavipsychrobacter sp.]